MALIIVAIQADDVGYRKFKSGDEAEKWWRALYQNLHLTKEEIATINSYTFGDFSSINGRLRSGESLSSLNETQKKMVNILDKALSKTIIFENIITYRYESLSFLTRLYSEDYFKKIYKDGSFTKDAKHHLETINKKKYKDYGFMSTTLVRDSVFQTRQIELVIKVPKYTDALYVSLKELAAFPTQYELLFPRNRVMEIDSYEISDDNKRLTIYVTMLPPCHHKQVCTEEKVDNLKQPSDKP